MRRNIYIIIEKNSSICLCCGGREVKYCYGNKQFHGCSRISTATENLRVPDGLWIWQIPTQTQGSNKATAVGPSGDCVARLTNIIILKRSYNYTATPTSCKIYGYALRWPGGLRIYSSRRANMMGCCCVLSNMYQVMYITIINFNDEGYFTDNI